MVSNPGLREVIGANALRAVAGANLDPALLGDRAVARFKLGFVKAAVKLFHRLFLVLELGAFLLAFNDSSRGLVYNSYRGLGLVDVLTSRAA